MNYYSLLFKTITVNGDAVSVENEYYKILIDKDIIDYNGNVILTSHIDRLNTIDKKGV